MNKKSKTREPKFYILTDLEGVAGVSSWSQTREPSNVNKMIAMDLLAGEVNAAIRGILDADSRAIVHVLDGHGYLGVNSNQLHPKASLFLGRPPTPLAGLDASFRAMLFVGQHAMAGVLDAPLCHTYSSREVKSFHLNGEEIGEFGCRTLLAASVGVPVIFLSGDDKAAAEAKAFLPDIHTVTTKAGGGVEWALHLSPAKSRDRIRTGVRRAVQDLNHRPGSRNLLPSKKPPYVLIVTLLPGAASKPWLKRGGRLKGRNRIIFQSNSLLDLPI
ncbi:MAG: M55 family metallopeptidase [Verrucomicrobia bacterium]|nr:M55 family metallopeptidase [Verrucomicrobiota bacterium]